jgi:hypothetical protein
LAFCARAVKNAGDSIIKLALNKHEITTMCNNEEKELGMQMNTVYDIITLEDILQSARERFKDDLYLIDNHQNDIEIIKKASELLDEKIQWKGREVFWYKPKTLNDITMFSMKPLPDDEQNLQIFQSKMNEVKTNEATALESG